MGMITESQRHSMAVWGSLLCFLCIGPSIALIAAGGYAKVEVESKIRLIEGFNTAALPGVIVFLGLYCVIHNAAAGTVLMSVRKPRMRERRAGLLLPGVVMGLILFLCLFLMAAISLGQTMYLEKSFDKGIVRAMRNYKSNRTLKAEIDNLQIDFKCCGNDRYTDWFKISWIREDYINYNQKNRRAREGGYKNDDVPFSCCDAESERPCINHHVHDNDMHYSYDYRSKTTIYPRGCRESLVNFYGKKLMTYVGLTLFGVSFFQFIVVLLTRFLQTSIATALELGDPEAETMGYFFSNKEKDGEKGEDGKPLLDDDDDDEEGGDEDEDEEQAEDEEEEPPEEEDEEVDEYAAYENMYGGWGGYPEEGGEDEEEEEQWYPPPRRRNRNRSNIGQYLNNTNNFPGSSAENIRENNKLRKPKQEKTVIGDQRRLKLSLEGKPRHPKGANSVYPRTDTSYQKRISPRYLECLELASSCKSDTRLKQQDKCRSKIAKVNAWVDDINDNRPSLDSYQNNPSSTLSLQQDLGPRLRNPVPGPKTGASLGFGHPESLAMKRSSQNLGFGQLESQPKGDNNRSCRCDNKQLESQQKEGVYKSTWYANNHEANRIKWECPEDVNHCHQNNQILNIDDKRLNFRNTDIVRNTLKQELRERRGLNNGEGQINYNTISANPYNTVLNRKEVRNSWTTERNQGTNSGSNGNVHGMIDLGHQHNQRNQVYNHIDSRNSTEYAQSTKRPQNNRRPSDDTYVQRHQQSLKYDTSVQHFRRDLVLNLNNNDDCCDKEFERPSNSETFPRIRFSAPEASKKY